MKIRSIELYVFLVEDAHFGYGIQQGSILPSLAYVPGRVIRGAMAGWAIRNGYVKNAQDSKFIRLFMPREDEDSEVSFPNCHHRGCLPAPFSLFMAKGTSEDPRTALVSEPFKPYPEEDLSQLCTAGKVPVDFLQRRDEWPSDIGTQTMEPFAGRVNEYGQIVQPAPVILDLKARHDEEKRRVGQGGLFAEEAVPCAPHKTPWRNVYRGFLSFHDDQDLTGIFNALTDTKFFDQNDRCEITLEDPAPSHLIFVGHRRVPAVIYGIDRGVVDTAKGQKIPEEFEPIREQNPIAITFISDLIAPEPPFPLTSSMLEKCLSLSGLEKRRVFCKRGTAYGYDTISDTKMRPINTIAAGSCGFFNGKLTDEALRRLWSKSIMGIGQKNRDGFGRFKVNWDIHSITNGEENQ